jgi:hypothetical protein
MGVTKGAISLVLRQGRGAGDKIIRGLLAVNKLTPNELYEAALAWARENPTARSIEYEDRYENRRVAVDFARKADLSEEAIRVVLGMNLKSSTDLPVLRWFDFIRNEDQRLKTLEEMNGTAPGKQEQTNSSED